MAVLVTGGAGYIGSHMVHALLDRGEEVVVLDNLTTGIRELVAEPARFVEGEAGDMRLVQKLVAENDIDAIIHFAGSTIVPESVENPLAYYANNTITSLNLIKAAVDSGVTRFLFSSSAAVYGEVGDEPVSEDAKPAPVNPYGRSKLMTEWMLADTARAHEFRHMALRYFNVAGADPQGRTGQSTPRATHLIKRACQVALGRAPHLEIFGSDYSTEDGTGVRDYIHVTDLVAAHAMALDWIREGGNSTVMNCGYGHGFSVRDVIAAIERLTGKRLPVQERPRRLGDPASVVADPTRIKSILGWKPQYDSLDLIVKTAHDWESRLDCV